ncbi:MAG: hypothetical protein GWP91_19410, partial [Rhodobacterales bacterium]|nr:hypothetical protein [Rhodobacterales bacterium]
MLWSLPLLTILGCGVNLPDPEIISVEPDRGWNGEDTVVTIHGQNFYPQVQLEIGAAGQADLDQTFSAWLVDPDGIIDDIALLTVGAEDYRNLVGVVESGIQSGNYDLRVEGPSGRSDLLKSAFVVADSRADGVAVVPEALRLTVNSLMAVELFLVDPNDQRVNEQDFGIDVWLVDDSGVLVTDAAFEAGGLIGAQSQIGGLSGTLGSQGSWIGISVDTPGIYTVFAAPKNQGDGVRDGDARIEWTSGSERSLGVLLPATPAPFVAQVGAPFDVTLTWFDEFGNPVPDPETVLVFSNCSGFLGEVLVSGPTTYSVNLERACASDRLGNILSLGSSDLFEVEPAAVDHFA